MNITLPVYTLIEIITCGISTRGKYGHCGPARIGPHVYVLLPINDAEFQQHYVVEGPFTDEDAARFYRLWHRAEWSVEESQRVAAAEQRRLLFIAEEEERERQDVAIENIYNYMCRKIGVDRASQEKASAAFNSALATLDDDAALEEEQEVAKHFLRSFGYDIGKRVKLLKRV
jgi:hypothetical protein